ncbi:transcription factor VBP-like [Onthophagus taurus]|uniref:transcription factor VBP-like n=1 Tax=Onthophagus taurus TaxID=166361 RepID=UPI0039BDCDD7
MYFYGGELVQVKNESQDIPLDLSRKKETTPEPVEKTETKPDNQEITNLDSNSIEVRPFKAYQRNPLSIMSMLPLNVAEDDAETMEEKYQKFRSVSLAKLRPRTSSNQNMRRTNHWKQNEDPLYREKREKNNLAAKRSRDARKLREDELTIRVAFLEAELIKLKTLIDQDNVVLQNIRGKIEEKKFLVSQQNERLDQLKQVYFYELNNLNKLR